MSLAAKYGNSRIFKYLLKKGANPTIGKNPFLVALENNQSQIWRYLIGPKGKKINGDYQKLVKMITMNNQKDYF